MKKLRGYQSALCLGLVISSLIWLTGCPAKDAAEPAPSQPATKPATAAAAPDKVFKILHVMSYHSPWEWTDKQIEGFQTALKDVKTDFKVMQMDTKRKSDEAWKQQITAEVKTVIADWKPDLVFTTDDDVQRYIAKDYVNSNIPFVFAAVNAEPKEYGFEGSKNVTGVLERMHYVGTMNLLKKLAPTAKKVVMISDNGKMWPGMIEMMKQQESLFPDIQVAGYDIIDSYAEFQKKILDYQDKVDAIGFFGVFEFRDEQNVNIPMETVLKWLAANNKLPDFSFWKDRVQKGTLLSVVVSGYDQGYQAGLLAQKILVDGVSPATLPMVPTEKGIPQINLETARRLGLKPDAELLLTAEVVQKSILQ